MVVLILISGIAGPVCLAQQNPVEHRISSKSAVQNQDLPRATLYVDGEDSDWPDDGHYPLDSIDVASSRLLAYYRESGFFGAELDSVSSSAVYVRRGAPAVLGRLQFRGESLLSEEKLRALLDLEEGSVLDLRRFRPGMERILNAYAKKGHHAARMEIENLVPDSGDPDTYDLQLVVSEGPVVRLAAIDLVGAERTRPEFLADILGLRLGETMRLTDTNRIADRLRATGLFRSVEDPRIVLYTDSTAALQITLTEASPGDFDLVLGYLPANTSGGRATVVGSGRLKLRNPFGSGRSFGLTLDRRPGQVASVEVTGSDPRVRSLPIALEAGFRGFQQDSTYGTQAWFARLGYQLSASLLVSGSLSREATRPGRAGARLRAGSQRIPRADITFRGFSTRWRNLDNAFNPSRGYDANLLFEEGRRTESFQRVVELGDTARVVDTRRQRRLTLDVRYYRALFHRQTLVLGWDARILVSDRYVESDLFFVGGAQSLRGYDEDQFRARTFSRLLTEYRLPIDEFSYVFGFFDLGYVDRPRISDIPASAGWYPGFGFGMQFQTAAGIVNMTYAMNREDGLRSGRVHIALSFGL